MRHDSDLLIVGGGPSGLSAAINGASEGLSVLLLDSDEQLGGQARQSAAIENYPGFPEGITGDELMGALVRQADKFAARVTCPARIVDIERDGNWIIARDDIGQEYAGRAALLSCGLTYRRLNAQGIGQYMGRGAFYGVPSGRTPTHKCRVVVVGGANSAGQAVVNLAKNKRAEVILAVRKTLVAQMSQYLIDRIEQTENITVLENTEIEACEGMGKLQAVRTAAGETLEADYLFIYIGAVPRTYWLKGKVALDEHGFVLTWADSGRADALPYETSLRGVFAAGDIRAGSVKRIASAAGEGAAALQMIHRRLGA